MKRNKPREFFLFFPAAVLLAGSFFLARFVFSGLTASGSFTVTDILAKEDNAAQFEYLKGRSIFGIDISRESAYLAKVYPQYRTIEIYKMFPGTLFIDFLRRTPIAAIKLPQGYYCVDENLIVFEAPLQLEKENLPVITGLEKRMSALAVGHRYESLELKLAVAIIQEIKNSESLRKITIKEIDVSQSGYVSLLSPDVPEVRFSRGFIGDKIKIFAGLCNQTTGELQSIDYIDLRFQEPVLKYKNAR
ncbi:MAG: hypothetical protein C4540_00570 [Candidatus Omnitrophota bacterium]|jgi:cell division septal protein FtsQ|nr:MAG: hypothetical protein C4540_00570 [Candidatus Omnitrophota bacterium]